MFGRRKADPSKTCWLCGKRAEAQMTVPNNKRRHPDGLPGTVDICLRSMCIQMTNERIERIERLNEGSMSMDIESFKSMVDDMLKESKTPEQKIVDRKNREFIRLGDTNSDTLGGDEMHMQPRSNQESDEVYPLIPGRVPSTVPNSIEDWCRNQTPSEASELSMARQVDAIKEK